MNKLLSLGQTIFLYVTFGVLFLSCIWVTIQGLK